MSESSSGTPMASAGTCEECGGVLPARAPLGLCPRCLVATGLELARHSSPPSVEPARENRVEPVSPDRLHRFGDYELIEEVARGGMGIVYRARQASLDRIVAVKVLLFGRLSSDEFIRRFRDEARVAAALQHPNIVSIHEVGEHEGQPYFSMDFVDGRNLADLARDGPLNPRRAAGYLQTICLAIQYSHDQGTLHRDLKPSNVLIDRFDQPRITDFGLATRLKHACDINPDGRAFGSPGYVSPEQADPRDGPPGTSSDIYSLGAILYHLLTGRPPFASGTVAETLQQVLHSDPAPPRLLNPNVPRDLETICLKCLQKKPANRYLTASAVADDLGHWLQGEPISARPSGRPERFWRWCRREPAIAALSAVTVLLLALGSLLVFWQWRRAEANAAQYRKISYADGMKAAYAEFKEGNVGQVARLLEEQKPRPGEPDLRGFEWHYLYHLTHPKAFLMLPRLKQVTSALSFTPDSRYLATYNWDDVSRLWNLDHPNQPLVAITNASGPGGFAANGEEYIVGTQDGLVRFYKIQTGKMFRSLRLGHDLVTVSANGKRLVTLDETGTPQVFDAQTGQLVFTCPQKVAKRSDFGWNPLVAISPDGRLLACVAPAASLRGTNHISIWHLESGGPVARLELSQVRVLTFSPDSDKLAIGGGEGKALIWSATTDEIRHLGRTGRPLFAAAFSSDSSVLAIGGTDETIQLWDVASATPRPGVLHANSGDIMSLAFSPNSRWLATGGRDTEVRLLPIGETPTAFIQEGVNADEWQNFAFSPDGSFFAAAFQGDQARVWNLNTLELVATCNDARFVVEFSQNSGELLLADRSHKPCWWSLRTGVKSSIPAYPGSPITTAALSPTRKLAALGHSNGELDLLEIDSGRKLATWPAHPDEVLSVTFSPDGTKLLSGSKDRAVTLWNVSDQKKIASNAEHRGAVCALAFSPDGRQIASACGADTIKIWNTSGIPDGGLTPSMSYHKAEVRTLAFSADGKTLASGSDDNTARLWNVATHQEIASFPMGSPVRMVRFSPDGKTLAIITRQGKLQLFSIP